MLVVSARLLARKRAIFGWYSDRLGGLEGISLNPEPDATADLALDQYDELPAAIPNVPLPMLAAGLLLLWLAHRSRAGVPGGSRGS